jgi:hypothetical protein
MLSACWSMNDFSFGVGLYVVSYYLLETSFIKASKLKSVAILISGK